MKLKIIFSAFSLFYFSMASAQCLNANPNYDSNGYSQINPFAVLNNKLFVQSYVSSPAGYQLKRYNNDGTLDTGFGVNGIYTTTTSVRNIYEFGNYYYVTFYANTTFTIISRLNYNGTLDTTFGNNGSTTISFNELGNLQKIITTSDNKLLLMCSKYTSPWFKLYLVKLNANGSIDTAFQNNGTKEMYVFPQKTYPIDMYNYTGNSVLLTSYGYSGSNVKFSVTKMDENGNLDTSFNSTGTVFFDNGNEQTVRQTELNNNKLYARIDDGFNVNNRIIKYDLGSLTAETTFTLGYYLPYTTSSQFVVYPDHSILTLGTTDNCYPCDKDHVLHKYLPNGAIDTSFCNSGIKQFNLSDQNGFYTDDQSATLYLMGTDIFISGSYSIPYTGPQFPASVLFTPGALDTIEIDAGNFTISPNPVKENLNINLNGNSFNLTSIKIYDTMGREIKTENITSLGDIITISTADLSSEIYLLKMEDQKGNVYKRKFIKK